jgi:hypothetical protein
MLIYGIADVAFEIGQHLYQLGGESSKECTGITQVLLAFEEEETSPKTSFFVKAVGNSTSDSRLAGTGHAVELEDALVTMTLAPILDLVEDINSDAFEILRWRRLVLLKSVECGILCTRELS